LYHNVKLQDETRCDILKVHKEREKPRQPAMLAPPPRTRRPQSSCEYLQRIEPARTSYWTYNTIEFGLLENFSQTVWYNYIYFFSNDVFKWPERYDHCI